MATPRTLADYIAQQGYRDIAGRYYDVSADEPRVVMPEDEFSALQKVAGIEGNILSGLQKSPQGNGYIDPATGKYYSAWEVAQQDSNGEWLTSPAHTYTYSPHYGLQRGSTQGDRVSSVAHPIGMYEDAGTKYYLTEGNDTRETVQAPYHDSYGLTDAFMDYATGPLGMAVGAAFLPGLLGGPEGALSGADLSVFDYPTLTGAEAATYGAPTTGYSGGLSSLADVGAGAGGALSGGDLSAFDYPALTGAEAVTYGAPTAGYAGTAAGGFMGPSPNYGIPGLGDQTEAAMMGSTAVNTPGAGTGVSVANGGTAGGGALSTAAGAAGTASSLSQLLGLSGNEALAVDALGRALPGLIGAYAANQQSGAMSDLANQYMGYGAPSRSRFEQSMTAGFDPNTIPGYRASVDDAMNSQMRALSTTGNPFGNPGGLIEAQKKVIAGTAMPAIQEYQRMNAGAGGLASLNAAVPGMQSSAIQGDTGMWNALGYGIDQAMNPRRQQSLAELMRSFTVPA